MNLRFFYRALMLLALLAANLKSNSQVVADFTATPKNGCAPLVVRFSDQSTGSPTSWKWDLGNSTTSFLQNPSATYFNPGRYAIKLVVRRAGLSDSVVKTDYIEVYAKPAIQFAVSDTTGCYPLAVQFTDSTTTASGTISSWLWDFGDGSTSTLQNPSHVYRTARNFNVTLQVRTSNGCVSTLIKPSLIKINTGVTAQFTNDNPNTCTAPVTINFQNQSTGVGTLNYLWNFGDNSTSTLTDPSHTYTTTGTYTIKLIVTNSNGCADTIIKPNAVTIGTVRAVFTSNSSVCQNNPIGFVNTSAPVPASVLWDFGDNTTSTDFSPSKQFSTPGVYTVKMVANFGACSDSITSSITVLSNATSLFTTSDTESCKAPYTVNFTNQSVGAVSYLWNFGDGDTSSLSNPAHTYNSYGAFTVKLIVTNANGCTDTLTKANYISVKNPVATISNIPDSGCVPLSKTFNLSVSSPEPVVSYLWNFGDGNSSTDPSPTNTYTTEGVFDVTVIVLTANGCKDSLTVKRGIVTNNKPTANFSASPTNTCAKLPVNFTNLSTGGATKWLWDFGDSATSPLKNASHIYQDTGYFTIKLKIWKGGCMDSIVFPRYVHINPPIAKFKVTVDCTKPYDRVFTDQSVGADEWNWDFGDGVTSTLQSPLHIYATSGIFTVTLRVVNHTYGCDYTTSKQVQVINYKAQFTASDSFACKGSSVTFTTGLSLTEVNRLFWSFGDGTPSIFSPAGTNSITHVYSNAGTYNVRLVTTDKLGCAQILTKTAYIKVNGPAAKFTTTVPGACLNSNVGFTDASTSDGTHPIQQWEWSYGDGVTEVLTAPPFQHSYTSAGVYTVKLKVTDSRGCTDTFTINNSIIISQPRAIFNSPDSSSCPGKIIHFANQSTGPRLTYLWSFGDTSATSTLKNPSNVYNQDGYYNVTLTVKDQYGCTDSVTKLNYIKIASPLADFRMSDSIGNCPPLIVAFTDLSVNSASRRWDFGDSTYSTEANPTHFYNYPGTYYVTFTITSQGGCTNNFQRKVLVKGPEGSFTYSPLTGCSPVAVNFNATTNGRNSFIWDFNDGSTISGPDSTVSYVYTYPGKYLPKMILIDQTGCQVPIIGEDSIYVSGVNTHFSVSDKLVCDAGFITFTDSSIGVNSPISSYHWNFGDGSSSVSQNPVHQYITAGVYHPVLIATTLNGCSDTLVAATPITIVPSPKIKIAATGNGCTPLTVTFNSQLTVPDTSSINWSWNFDNGNTSSTANPAQQNYTAAGIYNVTLVGTNSSGCKDSVSKTIEAYAIPLVSAGNNLVLCKGIPVTLQGSGADTYSWSPATNLSCVNCANPVTNTNNDISYVLTGTTVNGCSAKDTVDVTVKTKFIFTHSGDDSVCKGQSRNLTAGGGSSYSWSPSSGLSNSTISNPVATPDVSTTYRVIAADDIGCFKDTGYISIRVNPIPTVNAGIDQTINAGKTVDLIPEISSDVTDVNWQPTTGLFRNFYPGITVKPTSNTEYTVEVKNRGACTARDRVTVFVICNGSNIFVPNTFSPNGDGANEIFYPRGTGLFKIRSLRIYNRWGEIVFENSNFDANNPSYGWDGTKKGIKMNPDVFVYTLELMCDNGSVLTYRGNIALVK